MAFTVVDCGFSLEFDAEISYDTAAPRRNGATVEVLDRADVVLVVGGADPVSLSRMIRGVHELKTVAPALAPELIVNRVRGSLGWTADEITSTLTKATGISAIRMLPDDPTSTDRALVQGKTLVECVPDAKLSRALGLLAAQVAGGPPAVERSRRLLRRWF
ncbi:MAG: hypothetical protein H0V07_11190 [Propionibacteriales bacterium]|nr:hypothetical protein [Propionibacteriales bacterium]